MKAIQFIKIVISFCTLACTNNQNASVKDNDIDSSLIARSFATDTFETGKVITHVICKTDAAQSYALYIPLKGDKKTLPVIYFFDPHGDGSYPLNKYKSLADEYNFILIGSNNSKNGNEWGATQNIWNTLFDDSKNRVAINTNRIYTCGFSGGAKVAIYVSMNDHNVKGVIANGAAIQDEIQSSNLNCSFTAIAGEGDMNMTDLVSVTNGLDKTQIRHRIIFFNGIHEWAPESVMNMAFAGFQLDAMHEKLTPLNNSFIDNYIVESKKRIAGYLNTNDYLKAERECKLSISVLDGLTNVDWFNKKEVTITKNDAYQQQAQAKQELFLQEEKIKAGYEQQLQQGDINYWTKTINEVKLKAREPGPEEAMYQRLQAYLSLAFYSISNQLIKNNQNTDAIYFVNLYKMADETNSEAWYFSALLNARNNNAKACEDDLIKAVTLGFSDKTRLMQQPEFQKTGAPINLTEIVSKMK